MSRSASFSSADLRRLVDVIDATSGDVEVDEFVPPGLLVALAALVSADDVSFELVDPYHRTLQLQCLDPDESGDVTDVDPGLVALWWRAFWESCAYPQRSGDFMTIWSSGDSLPGPPNGRHWQSFADAIGLGNGSDLVMSLEPQGSVDRRLLMWRDTRKDFTEVDAALLTLVRPHIEKMLQKRALETDSDLELTPRQQEVLRLASTGCSNAEIARLMVLSEGTVKKHLENIYSRLGVRNRAAAIAWVSDRGLA